MKIPNSAKQGHVGLSALEIKFMNDIGWLFRKQSHDIGIDATIEVVENGVSTGQLFAAQIKSGLSYFREESPTGITFRFDHDHYQYWSSFAIPVFIILHHPESNEAFWEIVSTETAINTGKEWKVIIPKANTVSRKCKAEIMDHCTYPLPANSYDIISSEDDSHAAAKRYSARILLNTRLSKRQIVHIILNETSNLRGSNFFRNDLSRKNWQGKSASVVWLFVFPSLVDEKHSNWICRSLWIDQTLEDHYRPGTFSGIEVGTDLVIGWAEDYTSYAKLVSEKTLTKEEYLEKLNRLIPLISSSVEEAITLTEQHQNGGINSQLYVSKMRILEPVLCDLYDRSTNVGGAPLECADLSVKFQNLVSLSHNIVLPFSDRGLKTWPEKNRLFLVKRAIRGYRETETDFAYEYRKIR